MRAPTRNVLIALLGPGPWPGPGSYYRVLCTETSRPNRVNIDVLTYLRLCASGDISRLYAYTAHTAHFLGDRSIPTHDHNILSGAHYLLIIKGLK